jgi:hypothetical protein
VRARLTARALNSLHNSSQIGVAESNAIIYFYHYYYCRRRRRRPRRRPRRHHRGDATPRKLRKAKYARHRITNTMALSPPSEAGQCNIL